MDPTETKAVMTEHFSFLQTKVYEVLTTLPSQEKEAVISFLLKVTTLDSESKASIIEFMINGEPSSNYKVIEALYGEHAEDVYAALQTQEHVSGDSSTSIATGTKTTTTVEAPAEAVARHADATPETASSHMSAYGSLRTPEAQKESIMAGHNEKGKKALSSVAAFDEWLEKQRKLQKPN